MTKLARLRGLRLELEGAQTAAVRQARKRGASWTDIGAALGVSAQAVHRRYGP